MMKMDVQSFEESYRLYEKICLYCGIAAMAFLLLTAVFFVTLHIPRAFGELTGRTARRAIRQRGGRSARRVTRQREGGELQKGSTATPVVLTEMPETSALGQAACMEQGEKFVVVRSIMEIHTDEVIDCLEKEDEKE